VPVGAGGEPRAARLPEGAAARPPLVLLGVRSSTGLEGYYAVGARTAAGPVVPTGFVAVDAAGAPGLGAWSYGRARGLEASRERAHAPGAPPAPTALLGAYLAALRRVS
jgi:hypothetical protein